MLWGQEAVSGEARESETIDTYSALAVALVNTEHGNVSPQVTLTVGRLLADDDPHGVRDTMGICLCSLVNTLVYMLAYMLTRKER